MPSERSNTVVGNIAACYDGFSGLAVAGIAYRIMEGLSDCAKYGGVLKYKYK